MTITVYPGPGTAAYQSSQYSVTINGISAYVYGYSRTAPIWDTQGWSAGESPYQSWVTWASDETVTVVVTRAAGAITSCTVYPTETGITKSISGGVLTLTVPANRRLQVEINGNKRDWLWLFSSPPITIPGGTTSWATYGPRTVSAVSAAGNTLTVPSGHGLVANERVRYHTTGTYPTAVGGDLTEADFYYVVNPLATTIQLARTSGGAAIDITSAGSGTMQVYRTTAPAAPLYFPAGDWRIGRLLDMQNGYPVYLDGSAHVTGTYDLRGCTAGSHIIGHGVIKANLSTWEVVVGLPTFAEQLQWSACYGSDGATFERNNRLEGVTIVCPPFYTLGGYEFAEVQNVQILSGWTPNADGFDVAFRSSSDISAEITDCLAWCGDDAIKLLDYYLDLTVDGVYCVQSASSAIIVDYFGSPRVEFKRRICRNIYARQLQLGVTEADPAFPTNSVVKAWVDSSDRIKGAYYFDLDGLTIVGELLQPILSLEVRPYPWAPAGAEQGQIAIMTLANVVAPAGAPRSRILGWSRWDTPHDIALNNWTIGGVAMTAANFSTYVQVNEFPYNLYVGGAPVVDVWTTTGSWFASSPAVSPWSFLPASGRIGGSRALLLPNDVAWPGTATPSRGVLPSIGSYSWNVTSQTAAFVDLSLQIAPQIAAGVSTLASASVSIGPSHVATASASSSASVSASLDLGAAIAGGPVAAASVAADVGPSFAVGAAPTAVVGMAASLGLSVSAGGEALSEAGASVSLDMSVAPIAAPLVEAAQATVDLGPAITIAATAETAGALSAYLDASIGPDLAIGAEVESIGAATITLPELGVAPVAEPLIDVAAAAAVELEAAIEAEPIIPSELFAGAAASLGPSFEAGGETLSTASLAATLDLEHAIEAEIDGVYNLRTAELEVIRTALLGMLGRSAATAGATVIYEAEPQGQPPPATATILRATMLPVTRQLIGHDGEPLIQQDGRMQIQVLFPRGTGTLAQALRLIAIVGRYPAQTVVASVGVTLTGTADVRRIGQENGRLRWDVTIPWRSMRVETSAADPEPTETLQTVEGALEAVRTIWHSRIELAVPGEGWAGLRTYYDDVGPFEVPPPVPWCGVWTEAFGTSSREASGPTETVLGQTMVQLHTDQSLGVAGSLRAVNRIATEANRQFRSVLIGVATVVGSRVTPAGTWQTTIRIPFRFEKLRG